MGIVTCHIRTAGDFGVFQCDRTARLAHCTRRFSHKGLKQNFNIIELDNPGVQIPRQPLCFNMVAAMECGDFNFLHSQWIGGVAVDNHIEIGVGLQLNQFVNRQRHRNLADLIGADVSGDFRIAAVHIYNRIVRIDYHVAERYVYIAADNHCFSENTPVVRPRIFQFAQGLPVNLQPLKCLRIV